MHQQTIEKLFLESLVETIQEEEILEEGLKDFTKRHAGKLAALGLAAGAAYGGSKMMDDPDNAYNVKAALGTSGYTQSLADSDKVETYNLFNTLKHESVESSNIKVTKSFHNKFFGGQSLDGVFLKVDMKVYADSEEEAIEIMKEALEQTVEKMGKKMKHFELRGTKVVNVDSGDHLYDGNVKTKTKVIYRDRANSKNLPERKVSSYTEPGFPKKTVVDTKAFNESVAQSGGSYQITTDVIVGY